MKRSTNLNKEISGTPNILVTEGLLREKQIIGDKEKGVPPIIPVSHGTWWKRVNAGIYPPAIKMSPTETVWAAEDIRELLARIKRGEGCLPWKREERTA